MTWYDLCLHFSRSFYFNLRQMHEECTGTMQLIYDMIWHMSISIQIIEYYGLDRTDIQCIAMSGGWLIQMFSWYLCLMTWLHSDEITYLLSSISHITPPMIECYNINLLRAGLSLVRHHSMFNSRRPGGCWKMIWLLLFESIHIFSFIAGNLRYSKNPL